MELLQDGVTFAFALGAIVLSVSLVESLLARSSPARGRGALWGLLLSFVCIFVISEVGGWIAAIWLGAVRMTAYGRIFSYAAFGLILYVPIRIYQLMRMRHAGQQQQAGDAP